MTNHVHLVFRSTEGIPPGQLLGSFKRHTSMAVVKAIKENDKESRKENLLNTFKRNGSRSSNVKYNQFWRQDNKPIELWSKNVITQKIRYIHNNPVEQGLVFRPEDYRSAVDYSGEKGILNGVVVVGLI
jgi:REP element-mobilizing transposase RayT